MDKLPANVKPISKATLNKSLAKQQPYKQWPPKLRKLFRENPDMGYSEKTKRDRPPFQLLSYLADHPQYSFTPKDLQKIQEKLVPKDNQYRDVIQAVNKCNQKGLKRYVTEKNGETYYGLPAIEFDDEHLAKRARPEKFDRSRQEQISRDRFKRLSEEQYQIGHRHPGKPLTSDNIVLQPKSLNQSYKDRWIFNGLGLPKYPNPDYIKRRPEAIGETFDDVKKIQKALNRYVEEHENAHESRMRCGTISLTSATRGSGQPSRPGRRPVCARGSCKAASPTVNRRGC